MKRTTFSYLSLVGALVAGLLLVSCDPDVPEATVLGSLPGAPEIRVEILPDSSNRVVVELMSDGYFSSVWEFEGGAPATSTERLDTVFFANAGEYTISLHASAEGGAGTVVTSQQITMENDAVLSCSDMLDMLMGGCEEGDQKCWIFSQASGAVAIGPTHGSTEWFASQESGLVPEQYDDAWCFTFDGTGFEYRNAGSTIDPWNGYVAVAYDPPTDQTWQLLPGAGENGETRIVLPEGAFMGVWDSGPFYDIVTLTENELVVVGPQVGGTGWFTLKFVAP